MDNHGSGNGRHVSGVIGFFDSPEILLEAMRKVRAARYQHFDAFSPYPVHGLEAAQGLRRSPLPFVTFGAALTGCSLGFLLQYWTSAVDWPLNVGGKPFNSWPAFVPVMFECTILFAGLATVAGMFLFNGLPNTRRKIFDPSLTRDRFAIVVEAPVRNEDDEDAEEAAPKRGGQIYKDFKESEVQDFLRSAGAREIRSVYTEGWF
jgi:hypothetical protein